VDSLPGAADEFEVLFRANYVRLVRALTLLAGSPEDAADAVQDAFVKAHLRWRTIRQYDDPMAWVRRVAINGVRDQHRRSRRKQRAMETLSADAMAAAPSNDAHDTALLEAIDALPRQQRAAIALYYLGGLSVSETAAALAVSEGAVKFHLHQGRERLRLTVGAE